MFDTLLVILVASSSVIFISFLLGRYIYRRAHHLPTGDCACCGVNKKKFLKDYYKKFPKSTDK